MLVTQARYVAPDISGVSKSRVCWFTPDNVDSGSSPLLPLINTSDCSVGEGRIGLGENRIYPD